MDEKYLRYEWSKSASSGSLLIPKHDPNKLTIGWKRYRSVLSSAMSSSLENFIKSDDYSINHFEDKNYPNGAGYYELIPDPSSEFKDVGSIVPSGSLTPSGSLDRLIIVSGSRLGWHIYAENSNIISGSISSGRLIRK